MEKLKEKKKQCRLASKNIVFAFSKMYELQDRLVDNVIHRNSRNVFFW